jgi:hypothetical protein
LLPKAGSGSTPVTDAIHRFLRNPLKWGFTFENYVEPEVPEKRANSGQGVRRVPGKVAFFTLLRKIACGPISPLEPGPEAGTRENGVLRNWLFWRLGSAIRARLRHGLGTAQFSATCWRLKSSNGWRFS